MRKTPHIAWNTVALAALAVGAFVVGLAPLSDGDLWWHLTAGREIVRTHALPVVDTFSSGAVGRPWIDVHWGFQLAAFALHAVGGLRALVLAKCALVAIGALLLAAAVARGAGPRARAVFATTFLLALFAGRGLLLLRPVIPTLVFLAAFFYVLERFRTEERPAWLVLLPLLQVAWANVQGLSMLGPALVAAYACAPWRRARWLLGALALCLAACAATPYGVAGLALPFRLLARLVPAAGNVYAANVAENVPPWILERTAPGQLAPLVAFLVLAAASLASARRLVLSHVLVLGGLVALALAANRNVLLLYWLGTPIIVIAAAPALERLADALARARLRPISLTAGRLALPAALVLVGIAAAREPSLAEPAPFRAPAASADAIAARGGEGTIFAADQSGGYVMWRLGPAWKPFIDTRLVLRSAEEFAEYLALADEPSRFDAWEARHPMDYVLLPVGYPDRYLGLVGHLQASARWRLIHTDGTEVLFARADASAPDEAVELGSGATVEALLAGLERRYGGSPTLREAARLQLARLELAAGEPALAERVLAGTGTAAAESLRARCRLVTGDLEAAAGVAERLLARDADDVGSLDVLATIAARRGDGPRAAALLRRALAANPFDPEAQRILETWEGHEQSR